jgi:hypothetical protein
MTSQLRIVILAAFIACGCGSSRANLANPDAGGPDATADGATGGDASAMKDGQAVLPDSAPPADGASTGPDGSSVVWPPLPSPPSHPQLWYLHQSYLAVSNSMEPAYSEGIIDSAVAAGYTGMALSDDAITRLNEPGFDPSLLKTVVNYAIGKGLTVLPTTDPYGYSNDMVKENGNLAEGMQVIGTQFTVTAGTSGNVLSPINSLPPLQNGNFESGQTGWFSFGDARVGLDTTSSDCHGGNACGKLSGSASATDNARFTQAVTLTAWRLYHVQFWVRTQALSGNAFQVEVLDTSQTTGLVLLSSTMANAAAATSWTRVDLSFNSRDSTAATLYFGIWGGNQGTLWIDDIVAEETSLMNVLRRGGAPVRLYSGGTTYTEGTDYATISDPMLNPSPGNFDAWHTPPIVAVPPGSALTVGATVSADYYTVIPLDGGQVGVCLSEPGVLQWVQANITAMAAVFPAKTNIFLGYDEMRQVDSCELCRSKNLTAGQLLAWNLGQTWSTITAVTPGVTAYLWDDMFDPNHNATSGYQYAYPVQGDLTGSWLGLQPGFIIMNWNLGKLTTSLSWFAGKLPGQPHGFQQIIAGYYDSGDGASAATSELTSASGIPGVIGLMYTTWTPDYSQLAPFASAALAGWSAYTASTP